MTASQVRPTIGSFMADHGPLGSHAVKRGKRIGVKLGDTMSNCRSSGISVSALLLVEVGARFTVKGHGLTRSDFTASILDQANMREAACMRSEVTLERPQSGAAQRRHCRRDASN